MAFSVARVTSKQVAGTRTRALARTPGLQKRFTSTETTSATSKPLRKTPSSAYANVTHPEEPPYVEPLKTQLERSERYILPVYARPPLVLACGKGCYVWDTLGRKYLDFTAGVAVNALGHADPEFVQFMTTQSSKLLHSSNVFHNAHAAQLAELLVTLTQREGGLGWPAGSLPPLGIAQDDIAAFSPAGGAKVFFSNTGTEANEGALKIVRSVGKARAGWDGSSEDCPKHRVACFHNAFHGRSLGSLSVTPNAKYQKPFAPLLPGVDVGRVNDVDALRDLVTEETCGVIVEPIQGEGGIFEVDVEWLRALRKRCDEVNAVLIYDEIQCGLYRTGALWAHSNMPVDAHPDIVTMAKPLANGYPIGAVMMRDTFAGVMTPGTHGSTFGGSPLACALGHHVLTRLSERSFVAHVAETGAHLRARLEPFAKWFPGLVSKEGVRGRGLMLGIPFREASTPGEVVKMCRERGVLVLSAGKDAVRLVPSLSVRREEVDVAVDVLESVLGELHQR